MQSDDVENILTSLGIERHRIVPTNVSQKMLRQKSEFSQFDSDISYFPLEWFDSSNDSAHSFCREGIAFLPPSSSSSSKQEQIHLNENYEWRKVSIRQYNNKSNKWHIEDDDDGKSFEVPRIYLMFNNEDPLKFSMRIQHAVQQRDNCECYLRFEAILNAFPMHRIPPPPVQHHDRIKKMLHNHVTKSKDKDAVAADLIEFYQREYTIVYQKVLAAQQLIKFPIPNINSAAAACWIELLGAVVGRQRLEVERGKLKNLTMECLHTAVPAVRCKKSQRRIQQLWLYCCPQSIKIMEFINNECEDVSRLSLFHLQTSSELPCNWEKFHDENISQLQLMADFLQATWIDKIVNEIQYQLADVGKGWFELDVNSSSWSMYKMSKLRRLIELVKQRMQVAIITLLKSSLQAYVNHLCQPCECLLHISDDFEWNANDLVNSPFHTTQPLFNVDLNFTNGKPTYSILNLEQGRLEKEIIEIFENCVLMSHQIPQIDPYLIKRLKFDAKNLKLSSIGLLDAEIQNQIFHLRRCYSKCLIPLYAYARQYHHKFIELESLNVLQYIQQKFIETSSSANEIEREIRRQMSLCDDMEVNVPENIIIGPFLVDTRLLKKSLIDKRMEIATRLKRLLLSMASKKVDDVQQRYNAIIIRVAEQPLTIEHLDDIAKWIPSVAEHVERLEEEMKAMLTADFKCIESFSIALPDEIFTAKWKALRMPQIVSRQINETLKQHEYDIERFRKMQASDETVFVEKIDEIARDIDAHTQGRRLFDDYRTMSVEIDSIWVELRALLERGKLLNKRCEIFNQPEIDMERLNELEQRLLPHHNLWTATSNFLSSKEMWTEQMPLSKLNVQSIEAEMRRYGEIVEASREHFTAAADDDAEMMAVVKRVSDEMREMMEFIDIIKDLLNPDMHDKHWTRLTEQIGIKFEYESVMMTFADHLMRNILKYANTVRDVSREATIEATRVREEQKRRAIEKEERRRREEEEKQRKLLRRLARTDIFN